MATKASSSAVAAAATAAVTATTDNLPIWDILDQYFHNGGGTDAANLLVRHQVESYNEFIDKKLSQIISGFNAIQIYHNYCQELSDFKYKISISILNPSISKPIYQTQDGSVMLMTPHLARMNNLTYASNLYVDIHVVTEIVNKDGITERNENTVPSVTIGRIPIMVRSKACILTQMPTLGEGDGKNECRYDPGGYFIVSGNEKVVICQDRISENKTLVFAPTTNSDGLSAEIRSMPDGVFLPPKTTSLHFSAKPNHLGYIVRMNTTFLRSEIPVFTMFRALGIETDRDIISYIVYDVDSPKNQRMITELLACCEDGSDIHTKEDAHQVLLKMVGTTGTPREYLEKPEVARAILNRMIANDFLPHVGPCFRRKALYLGYMMRKLFRIYLGYQEYDNRDSYLHKRIDTTGVLMSNLFRQCYSKMVKEMRNLVTRELNLWRANNDTHSNLITSTNVHKFFKPTLLETGLRYALSTGNWGVKTIGTFQNIRQGVAQVLNRMSYQSTLSHLRRINTPMEKSGKLVQPRKLENSQFGMICPAETPEGAAVGLVKNMAMSTQITISMSSAFIRECIVDLGVCVMTDALDEHAGRTFIHNMGLDTVAHVTINGDLVGYHPDPYTFYHKMKSLKRQGAIAPTTAIVWDMRIGSIHISTEAGRLCRPLFIVDEKAVVAPKKGRGKKQASSSTQVEADTIRVLRLPPERGEEWRAKYGFKPFIEYVAPLHSGSEAEGFIELMDTDEIDKAMVAMSPKDLERTIKGTTLPPCYTHCEIHPSLINGVLAVNIPFSDHNQSPRNCYQCLWEESPVLMAEGGWKRIKDVHPGDHVICFHPQTMAPSITRVIHQYQKPNMKPMVRIITYSGRSIIATRDHKFMTNKGWVEAGAICVDKDIAYVGIQAGVPNITAWGSYIPSECYKNDVAIPTDALDAGTQKRLTEMGILPLMAQDPKMPIFCRMLGWHIQKGVFRHKLDKDAYDDDGRYLGFIQYGGEDTALKALMDVMATSLPQWIGNVSVLSRKELIAAYLGAREQELDVNEYDAWLKDLELDVIAYVDTKHKETPEYTLIHWFGCRYNTIRLLAAARKDEYYDYKNYVTIMKINHKLQTLEEWMNMVKAVGNTMFVPVLSSQSKGNCMIADITVESDNHSFIGGDCFTVSNSAMGKQAVGVYMSNFNSRIDTMAHVLNYPQRPLVHTRLSKYTNSNTIPAGVNAVVAIMTYTGFNMEDSVMINQSALDRGLFSSTYYKSYRDQCNKNHSTGEEEVFTRPDPMTTAHMKPYNYDKLGEDGFIPKNTEIDSNDVLVGKIMPHKVHGIIYPRDTSMGVKANDEGYVDMNYTGTNGDGYKFCKVRLRKYRKPVVGDKVACAKKGHEVLTKNGFIPIENVTLEDEVAVLKDGKYLVYEKPEAIHHYPDFEGEMYHISNQGVDLDVTTNHRMWVSLRGHVKVDDKYKDQWMPYGFQYAEDIIGKRLRYKKDAEWNAPDYQYILPEYKNKKNKVSPEKSLDMEAWLLFLGIWMAEGCAGYSYGVSIAANKLRVKKVLKDVMPRIGYKYNLSNEKVHIYDPQMLQVFVPLSVGATNKTLPDWVWMLSKNQCDILLHGMLLGDGNWTGTGIHYSTSSVKLREDVYRLAIHAGYAADVYKRNLSDIPPMKKDGTFIIPTTDAWIVHIREKRTNPTVNHGHTHEQEIQQEYTYHYKGPVYCLTVSSGVFMIRKNFKHVWTGNSRHAQKGSIGMIYPQEDMPFSKDGIIPDIILNPHAIPSRMTIAQLMECIMGKACSFLGSFGDATPFNDCTVEDIATALEKFGMERYGNEILYHGRSGQQIKTEIFIGPTFYQRLKHMVTDKMFSRGSNGPVVLLTRQPAEGRARNGGLRFGRLLPKKVRTKIRASPT